MSPLGLLVLLTISSGGALESVSFSTHSARVHSSAVIACRFPPHSVATITWHHHGTEILRYPPLRTSPGRRLAIDPGGIRDGVADLQLSDLSISDGELYACAVERGAEKTQREIRLDVTAPPQISVTHKAAVIGREGTLSVHISGFYPVDIDIKWLRGGEMLSDVTVEKPQRNPDGTFSVKSSVRIRTSEEDRERTFSCRVQHGSLSQPLQEDFQIQIDAASPTMVIILCSVIGGILVLILIILAIYIKKKRQKHPEAPEANNLQELLEENSPSDPERQNHCGAPGADNSEQPLMQCSGLALSQAQAPEAGSDPHHQAGKTPGGTEDDSKDKGKIERPEIGFHTSGSSYRGAQDRGDLSPPLSAGPAPRSILSASAPSTDPPEEIVNPGHGQLTPRHPELTPRHPRLHTGSATGPPLPRTTQGNGRSIVVGLEDSDPSYAEDPAPDPHSDIPPKVRRECGGVNVRGIANVFESRKDEMINPPGPARRPANENRP